MNVGYENYNTRDVAQIFGVHTTTVTFWCKKGFIRYQDVSGSRSSVPRYLFESDEVDRVSALIKKYGKRTWLNYNKIPNENVENTNPEEYIPDDTDDIYSIIKEIRDLKVQRDKLLMQLDSIDELIKTKREKVIAAI